MCLFLVLISYSSWEFPFAHFTGFTGAEAEEPLVPFGEVRAKGDGGRKILAFKETWVWSGGGIFEKKLGECRIDCHYDCADCDTCEYASFIRTC